MGADRQHHARGQLARVGNVLFGADRAVTKWVAARIPGFQIASEAKALGVVKDGQLVAGIVYERFNGVHIEASIAALPDVSWASRGTLFSMFHYPFGTLGCQVISVIVPMSNLASINLASKLGFEPEAIIRFAAHDGSDILVMKMYRKNCRWIQDGQKRRRPARSAGSIRDSGGGIAVQSA